MFFQRRRNESSWTESLIARTAVVGLLFSVALVLGAGSDDIPAEKREKVWKKTKHTFMNYEVAGVNLATYGMDGELESMAEQLRGDDSVRPFELFEDFDIGARIVGNEDWWDMQSKHKRTVETLSISFYNDKIAVKRWLQSIGIGIPEPFALVYASELTETGLLEDIKEAVLALLPKERDYVIKPSNLQRSHAVWVVSHDRKGTTRVSKNADESLKEKQDFDPREIADSIAESLSVYELPDYAPRVLHSVKPGIVIEERFTSYEWDGEPGLEFKFLVVWGRVFVANWRIGSWRGEWWPGVVHRNGTMVDGSLETHFPDWIDWPRAVEIAERLGAHKDTFRVDLFVGVPANSPALREGSSESERKEAVQYVVNEISSTSAEPLPADVLEEATRLWIAGYKIGNYRTVPNTEVPLEFRETTCHSILPTLELPNGVEMPRLSLGTSHLKFQTNPSFWGFEPERVYRSLDLALEAGIRGIDAALVYRSHTQIRHVLGEWFRSGRLERKDIFLSSKIFHSTPGVVTEHTYIPNLEEMNEDEVRQAVRLQFEQTLMELGVGYLDLMMLHWPAVMNSQHPKNAVRRLAAWQVLEEYYERGWVRAIGVSNFSELHLEQLMADGARVRPMVNQIEASVYMQYVDIVAYCKQHGIVVQAFSPLGRGQKNIVGDQVLKDIAKKHKKDPGQIALRYLIQLDYAVTFLSSSDHLELNQQIFDFQLDEYDMHRLTDLNRPDGSIGVPSPYDMS